MRFGMKTTHLVVYDEQCVSTVYRAANGQWLMTLLAVDD